MLGSYVSQSIHAAGIVASPITLYDNYGVFRNSDGLQIICLDMDCVHDVGLVKYDILGLRQIPIIKETCKYVGIPYPKSYQIDWEDEKVWEDIKTTPIALFQFEEDYSFRSLCNYGASSIDDMTVVTAAIRPSGASYREDLFAHKPHKNPSELIDNLLSDTNGYLCYQEQIISFLQQICGLSGSEADDVRRGIARKKVDVLQAHMSQILDGYCEKSDKPRDIAEKEAEEFIQIIEDASSYMFGRNHAIAYSMIGYLIGYLRYYYPLEFITAFFNYSPTESDISNGMQLAKLKGIKIKPPKFRYSKAKYFMDKETNSIYKGISSIKYMSDDVANGLYNLRDNHYDTFIDLLKDIKEKTVINARQLEILIKLDFFSEFGNARELLALNDWFVFFKYGAMKTIKKDKIKDEILTKIVARNSTETATQFKIVNMDNILRDVELMQRSYDIKDFGHRDKILQQIEYYGYIDINEESQNIEDKKKLIVLKVTPMKAKTGRNAGKVWCYIVDTQSIGSGKHGTWTILEDVFRSNPVKQYDIIKAELFSPKVYNGRKYWYLNKYSQIY